MRALTFTNILFTDLMYDIRHTVLTSTLNSVDPYPCHSFTRAMYLTMACSWFIPCSFFHLSITLILTAAASSLIHASRLFSSSSFCRLSEPLLKLRLSVPSRKLERFLSAVPERSATEPVPGANVLAEFCTRARSRVMGNT